MYRRNLANWTLAESEYALRVRDSWITNQFPNPRKHKFVKLPFFMNPFFLKYDDSKQLIGTFMANLLSKQLKCPRTHHSLTTSWAQIIVSSRVSAPLKYWPHPFLPRPLPKNSKSVRPPLWATPWKVWITWFLPLKWTLVKKSKDSFFKETKDFISNNENKNTFEHWNMNIQL